MLFRSGHFVVLPIGMGEVSSCMLGENIKPGAQVQKGDDLGHFQYGGSTVCCVFQPEAISSFALDAIPAPDHPKAQPLHVNAFLAQATD